MESRHKAKHDQSDRLFSGGWCRYRPDGWRAKYGAMALLTRLCFILLERPQFQCQGLSTITYGCFAATIGAVKFQCRPVIWAVAHPPHMLRQDECWPSNVNYNAYYARAD